MIEFKQIDKQHIEIWQDEKKVGQIFSPSGSGEMYENAIQVCGFSEAFDLWGCGPFGGFKDIQLLYDGIKAEGKDVFQDGSIVDNGCLKCFREPCQCENPKGDKWRLPFKVKHHWQMDKRLKMKTSSSEEVKNE